MAKKAKFPVGSKVMFKGYADDVPEDQRLMVEDEIYIVAEVNPEEESFAVQIDNPDFNSKKKESEDNSKTILVDVFYDEVEAAPDEDEEEAPAPKAKAKPAAKTAAKPAAKGKAKAAEVDEDEDEDGDEDGEADEAPAKPAAKAKGKVKEDAKPAAKGKAATKPAAKGKAKPAAKAAPVEEDKYPELENEDEEITSLIEDADLIELATELVEDSAALDYKLGGVLYHVRLSKAYQEVDAKYKENGGFGLFLKEQLNVEYRKAMYLIDIYYKFNQFGIDAAKVQELGWTKCAKIAAVMTEDNAEELVELAEGSSASDLSDTIKETYSEVGGKKEAGEKRKKVALKFRLWDDQATAVQEVLKEVQSQMGFKDPADAFEHILMEWAAEHDIAVSKPKADKKAKTAAAPKAKAGRRVSAEA